VIVVDMQHDFVHEDGALYGPDAARAVPVIVAPLAPKQGDEVFRKLRYDAFCGM